MSNFAKQSTWQSLVCPQCQGFGVVDGKYCVTCQRQGMFVWNGTTLLSWGQKITASAIAQDRLINVVSRLLNVGLFLFGASGLVVGLVILYLLSSGNIPLVGWVTNYSWPLTYFWLTALVDCYVVFRFQREYEKLKNIPRRSDATIASSVGSLEWSAALAWPKARRLDISPYFTPAARQVIIRAWELANKYRDASVNPIHVLISLLSVEQIQIVFGRLGVSFPALKKRLSNVLANQLPGADEPVALSPKIRTILYESFRLADELKQKKVDVTELLQALMNMDTDVKEMLYDLDIDLDKIVNVVTWLRINRQLRARWQHFRARATLRPNSAMNRSMTAVATPTLDVFGQDLTLLARNGYLTPCIGRHQEISNILNIIQSGNRRSVLLVGNPGVGRTTIAEGIAQLMVEEDVPKALRDKRLVSLNISRLVSGVTAAEAQQRLLAILHEVRRSGNILLFISDIHTMIGISAGREGSIDLADVLAKALGSQTVISIATTTPVDYRRYIDGQSSLDTVLERLAIEEVSGNEAIQILESKVGTFEYQNSVYFSYDAIAKIVQLSDRYLPDRYLPEKALQILQEVAGRVRNQKGKNGVISENDVAVLVSEKTNIPLAQITQEESEKLLHLEDQIHERLVNQAEAVSMVATSLRRARAEIRDTSRPIVNLLFLGPTGVGKTELAKTMAAVYFGAEEKMIRLDMSEYQEKSSVNRLIGAPPGLGSNEGGLLTELVRKNPFSLILLDEIEKAHPAILNVFLQVMDDGRLTDNQGRTVDFTNVIIIATSNAGTAFIQAMIKEGRAIDDIRQQLMATQLHQFFKPEFLNRFDGIVVFKPLTILEVRKIAQLMIQKVAVKLEEKGITLTVTSAGLDFLAKVGFDPEFGARPLRRAIQQYVQDELATWLLSGKIGRRDTVTIDADGQLLVTKAPAI